MAEPSPNLEEAQGVASKKSSYGSQASRSSQRRANADRTSGASFPKQRPSKPQNVPEPAEQTDLDEYFHFYLQFVKSLLFHIRDINGSYFHS